MEYTWKLIIALFPAILIIAVWYFLFFRRHKSFQQDYLNEMKAQTEKLERIAKALEHKNGTDVK